MVIKAVCGIGFGIMALTLVMFLLLSIIERDQNLTEKVFVNLILIFTGTYIILVIGLIVLFSFLSARQLKKKGQVILQITDKIKAQDLDFDIKPSGVKEIDQILEGMEDMRNTLKEALETQWRLEQNRKEQISALAHDFKTPITVLKGNIDLLQGSELADEYKEYIKDAKVSLEQIETYLSQLLEVTRAERGYLINKQRIELSEILYETVSALKQIANEKEITILTEKMEETLFLSADKILLERVFYNLISNALDYTPKKGIIKIILMTDKSSAIISVIDSGCGFSQNALKHGMEQFFMDDSSRGRKNHYGLGLYIVASIVKQHNGTMQLENDELTGGARISIYIPLI
jgi:signal transduction histidine kinase